MTRRRELFRGATAARGICISQLADRYRAWAAAIYSPSERATINAALKVLTSLFGPWVALHFGPVRLREVREAMIAAGWNRLYINKQIHRVCAAFKWAASNELLPVTVYQSLKTIEPLKRRRTIAPEPEPVTPADGRHVAAVRPFVSRQVWAIIELQRLTGSRPGEIIGLRAGDIDRSGKIWRTKLLDHKTEHQGVARVILFGPQAQAVLRPWLLRPDGNFLFSPAEAEDERIKAATAARRTRAGQGHIARGKRRAVGKKYSTDSYRRAIERACRKAGVPRWHPHQLRHAAATEIRRRFGLEAAQLVLGHCSALVTDAVYAQRDAGQVEKIMSEMG